MATAPGATAPAAHSPWLIANVKAQISFGLLAMTLNLASLQEWGDSFSTGLGSVQTALAVVLPTLLLGLGHGLLNPPALDDAGFALTTVAAQLGLHRCRRP